MDKELHEAQNLTKEDLLRMAKEGKLAAVARAAPGAKPGDAIEVLVWDASITLHGRVQEDRPVSVTTKGLTVRS